MSDAQCSAITMPKWGMAMAHGKVVDWLASEGSSIEKGDEILEIETEKTVNILEAADSGCLTRIVAQPGDELPVGALLGVITKGDVENHIIDSFVQEFQEHFIPEEVDDELESGPSIADVDGRAIAYRTYESISGAQGLPLVLIHGFGGTQESWAFLASELSKEYKIVTLDLPGHGASEKDAGEGTLSFLAEAVAGLLDEISEPCVHIAGHSLGAAVAVEFARRFPERAASLTLISGAGAGTHVDRPFIEGFISANRQRQLRPFVQQLFMNTDFVTRRMIEDTLNAKRLEGVEDCLKKIADQSVFAVEGIDPNEALAELSMPVQVIWGENDRIANVRHAESLPGAVKVTTIENAGHMVHIEEAPRVIELIAEFIKKA